MTPAGRLALLAVSIAWLGGCGSDDPPADDAGATTRAVERRPHAGRETVRPVECPSEAGNCASVTGTILYVERVDPDGDGDAHFVLLDPNGITGPGISVVDVAAGLRPHPLPGPGDVLSAAGPVYPGSYGQRQIEADVVRVAG